MMTFGQAIKEALDGKAVARSGWNGKGMWIAYSPGATLTVRVEKPWGEANRRYAESLSERGISDLKILPYLTMRTAGGEVLPGWLASQTDMLATDWGVVEAV